MGVYIDDNKLVIITKPRTIPIDLPIKINESLDYDIKFIIGRTESSAEYAEYAIKTRLDKYCIHMDMNIKKNLVTNSKV